MDRQCSSCGGFCKKSGCERENVKPKEWVGLTDDEIQEAGRQAYCRGGASERLYHIMWNSQPSASIGWSREELISLAAIIEAKLKENTYEQ